MLKLLTHVVLSTSLHLSGAEAQSAPVSYLAGAYSSSCVQVCGAADMLCADSMVEKMNCASLASTHCGSNTMSMNANVGCYVSGCYVNCADSYYYSKSSTYSTCNTGGTCLTSSSNLNKICPCYEHTSLELEGWSKMFLFLIGAIMLATVGLVVKSIMCKDRKHEELNSTIASDYDIDDSSGQSGLLAFLSASVFRKSGDKSSKIRNKIKIVKMTTTKLKSEFSLDEEMDETRDMAIK